MGESGDGRYSTEELQLIVERAAALQHQSDAIGSPVQRDPNWLPTDEGMTLQSVKEIAAEVGLEPQFVEDAVRALRHETRHAAPVCIKKCSSAFLALSRGGNVRVSKFPIA